MLPDHTRALDEAGTAAGQPGAARSASSRIDDAALQGGRVSLYFDRTGTPIDLERWTELREDASYRLLERTSVGCFEVITAWSGIDQGHASIYFGEPPLVFGTIARHMTTGAFRDDLEAFAATEEEALENHRALVGRLAVLP